MLERAGEDGSVVVSWGASRAHSLSNRPFPQVTRPVPGVTPAGLRYSALTQCTGRWRCSIRDYKVAGVRQDKRTRERSLVLRPLHQKGPVLYLSPYPTVHRTVPYRYLRYALKCSGQFGLRPNCVVCTQTTGLGVSILHDIVSICTSIQSTPL